MKISLVASSKSWHTKELVREARKLKISIEIVQPNISIPELFKKNTWGDIIIWRSSPIDQAPAKRSALLAGLRNKTVINDALLHNPFVTNKLFQQKYLSSLRSDINTIETRSFESKSDLIKAVKGSSFPLPLIKKPSHGSQGSNISLLLNRNDIDSAEFKPSDVYQPFVPNNGDYRVLIVGGKSLGAIKRTAPSGSFLNNVSKGGSPKKVSDKKLLNKLNGIALEVSSAFGLTICGVDIIQNREDQKYYFLEVNTVPQWNGFQSATKINVASEIMYLCHSLNSRKNGSTYNLVKSYYEKNFELLGPRKFHFASRSFLWNRSPASRRRLMLLRNEYVGENQGQTVLKLKGFLRKNNPSRYAISKDLRNKYWQKYPKLQSFNDILFFWLFSKNLFQQNLRSLISRMVKDEEFLAVKKKLIRDLPAIAALSTHAINYFYLVANYLNKEEAFDPEFFFDLSKSKHCTRLTSCLNLRIYLLTHCVIGASQFYSRKIVSHIKTYTEILKLAEKIISEHYQEISLDNKLEFLVCCSLCDYSSLLHAIIMSEADFSLSKSGNYIIDKYNSKSRLLGNNLIDSEHRNMLYLMAKSTFYCNILGDK